MLLLLVTLDKRSKLTRAGGHRAFVLLLIVKLLRLRLKFFNDLILLAEFEMELSELVLQYGVQSTVLRIGRVL